MCTCWSASGTAQLKLHHGNSESMPSLLPLHLAPATPPSLCTALTFSCAALLSLPLPHPLPPP